MANILGIIIINITLRSFNDSYFEKGLVSQFIIDLFSNINLNFLENIIVYYVINFLLLLFGIYLILLSFRISISWINKITSFFKVFKYFKFIFFIFKILKYIKFDKKNPKKTVRSEPTIKKKRKLLPRYE